MNLKQLREDLIGRTTAVSIRHLACLHLLDRLESAEEALALYADKQSWEQEIFLCASAKMRDDLEETDHSRFTPGARAREHFKKYACENPADSL